VADQINKKPKPTPMPIVDRIPISPLPTRLNGNSKQGFFKSFKEVMMSKLKDQLIRDSGSEDSLSSSK
jgi:hypothetical protein